MPLVLWANLELMLRMKAARCNESIFNDLLGVELRLNKR